MQDNYNDSEEDRNEPNLNRLRSSQEFHDQREKEKERNEFKKKNEGGNKEMMSSFLEKFCKSLDMKFISDPKDMNLGINRQNQF